MGLEREGSLEMRRGVVMQRLEAEWRLGSVMAVALGLDFATESGSWPQ